jgi:Flp pilus assembly protein TadG
MHRLKRPPATRRKRTKGQALVEFALVFPIFLLMLIGFVEFAFVFNALLSISHATRDAALIAAEAGNAADADCLILQQVENDVSAPADKNRIQQVVIYRSDQNGAVYGGQQNVYVRTGLLTAGNSTSCTLLDGSTLTVPYTTTAPTYPTASRCDILAGSSNGCDPGHPTVDTIGVKIVYRHTWLSPIANFVSLGGNGVTLTQSNAMRMEPVL